MKNPFVRIILGVLVVTVVSILLVNILLPALGITIDPRYPYKFVLLGTMVSIIITVVEFVIYRKFTGHRLSNLGFRMNLQSLLFLIVCSVFIILVTIGFMELTHVQYHFNTQFFMEPKNYLLLFSIAVTFSFAAFQEEVLNRGYFFANLKHMPYLKM